MTPDEQRWQNLSLEAGKVFTPRTAIDERSLFAGREEQVRQIVDVVNEKGAHAILFGDRGVGKTSLVSVLPSFLHNPGGDLIAPRVNCDTTDSFESVWRKAFEQVDLTRATSKIGFGESTQDEAYNSLDLFGDSPISPDSVRRALTLLAIRTIPIFIFDEFDRISAEPRRAFADTIKGLSDHGTSATVVLVGVADSVDQLIQEHQSVERALIQIRMPRMSSSEIRQILVTGTQTLAMDIEQSAIQRIQVLAQGLPHYAHLIGLHSVRLALDSQSMTISVDIVEKAIDRAIENAQQSIRSAHEYAIRSPRKENLFSDVLLSCALAHTDELGYFAAQDVRQSLRQITGKNYEIPTFAQHLNEFSEEKRGPILRKTGIKRRFRYRFINPMLQPFVIMRGIKDGKITSESLTISLSTGQLPLS
jgi:Cdc6-like AAA superfamily ATPase